MLAAGFRSALLKDCINVCCVQLSRQVEVYECDAVLLAVVQNLVSLEV